MIVTHETCCLEIFNLLQITSNDTILNSDDTLPAIVAYMATIVVIVGVHTAAVPQIGNEISVAAKTNRLVPLGLGCVLVDRYQRDKTDQSMLA